MTTSAPVFPLRPGEANGFAKTALHAIALDCATESATNGEADAKSRGGSLLSR